MTTTIKGLKETFGGNGDVYYFDCDNGNMSVYKDPNLPPNCVH